MKTPALPRCADARSWLMLLGIALASHAPAQGVNDGETNTLDGVTSNVSGTVTMGTNGSFTLLVLTNGALLSNTVDGVIGRNTGANSNHVLLHGANARWHLGGTLYVGSNGSFNRLTITEGARVVSSSGYLGFDAASSNN